MPKKSKKPDTLSYLVPRAGFASQHFLVMVAIMIVGILTVSQILVSGGPPRHDDFKTNRYVKSAKHDKTAPPKVPISVWRGPAQPMEIPAGLPPVIQTVPTTLPIVFVTIDDGWVQTKENLNWLSMHRLPFSLFLTNDGIKSNYQYFQTLQSSGMTIQNHTMSHHSLRKMNLDQQKGEVCGASDTYQSVFGERPTLFRPPYGEYNDTTRQAVADCGMKALVLWKATLEHGAVKFQTPNTHLQPGDIILAHFETGLVADMNALAAQLSQDHLQVAQLEEWVK